VLSERKSVGLDVHARSVVACGIDTLTGFALAVEIGDWDRFTGASIGA
jgi:hypothetical protein